VILFHAGIDIGLPEPCHCTPYRLRKVIDLFPGSNIVAAHMGGWSCRDDVEKYLLGREVYFDTSFSFDGLGSAKMERVIKEHGVRKILFGTDSPWTDQASEIANIKSMNFSTEEADLILGNNAKKLLSL
jgi:predicted TIM-barrel fold metal-dependent hydrolase